ncbi:MAG TPA: hypothetical protein VFU02_07675, partial [Polyangiaceae bacterium]|nr:hypothetical protein [Polyangiaceae bacterium]
RGETCEARNDCSGGLACVNGTCSKNDFDISISAKHCDRVECEDDKDCCGDRPREAPAKCANRNSICLTPTLGDCTTFSCTADSECGSGVCPPGTCSLGGSCETDADCEPDVCVGSACSISNVYCITDADCYGELSCGGYRVCNCANPDFNPSDPICTDPECEDVCTLRCDSELCVPDTSCESDDDCIGSVNDICEDGRCVECVENDDCSEAEEECVNNVCEKPCTENEECPLFHACEDGECIERGCGSDNECILAASRAGSAEDPRLFQCLAAGGNSDTHICKLPCENDAGCASSEVCDDGFCVFIGCKTDEECRAYFGIEEEETDDAKPYITKALCRE